MCGCNSWLEAKRHIKWWTIGTVSLTLLIMMIVFPSITNKKVGQSEAGVRSNSYTMELSGPYLQGAYTLDVGEEFLLFERTIQNLGIGDVSCLTKDKLLITLSVSAQYQYQIEYLIPILLKQFQSNDKLRTLLNSAAESIISNTCLEFTAEEYYTERSVVD